MAKNCASLRHDGEGSSRSDASIKMVSTCALSGADESWRSQDERFCKRAEIVGGRRCDHPLGLIFRLNLMANQRLLSRPDNLGKLRNWEYDFKRIQSSQVKPRPIVRIESKLKARVATAPERETYRAAAEVSEASANILLVFLIEVNGFGIEDDTIPAAFRPKAAPPLSR